MSAAILRLSHPQYRPDIDGLRAIAVLSVVAFHAFPGWMKGGFIGVDLFFVISGFLISSILFESLARDTFSFSAFYARRVRRIFPALLLVLAASYAIGWFVLFADEFRQLGGYMAAGAGFVGNLLAWSEAGYFDSAAEAKPLLHLWSLGVEEQFYIVWPLLLWLAWRARLQPLALLVGVVLASFGLNLDRVAEDSAAAFYSPLTRLWELACGGLLAWLVLHRRTAPLLGAVDGGGTALANLVSIGGCLVLAGSFWLIDKDSGFPGWWAVLPVLGSVLVILAGPEAWINRELLSCRVVVWFGLISYPLYLWHWPLLAFARILEGGEPALDVRSAVVLLAVFLAWLTYRFVERPVRFGAAGWARVAVPVALMCGLGAIGYGTHALDGLRSRAAVVAESANAMAFDWPDWKNRQAGCLAEVGLLPQSYCLMADGHPVRVALVGDSHANALFDFASGYFAERGKGVIQLGHRGCPPMLGVERDAAGCPQVMDAILAYLERQPGIEEVLITGRFAAMLTGLDFGRATPPGFYPIRSVADPDIRDRAVIFEAGLRALLERLVGANKRVRIILDSPELDFAPRFCLRSRLDGCRIDRDLVVRRQAGYCAIIERIAAEHGIPVVDLMTAFCPGAHCHARLDGKILYRDTHHLGVWGTEFLRTTGFRLD